MGVVYSRPIFTPAKAEDHKRQEMIASMGVLNLDCPIRNHQSEQIGYFPMEFFQIQEEALRLQFQVLPRFSENHVGTYEDI
jgi:hypothetical protein